MKFVHVPPADLPGVRRPDHVGLQDYSLALPSAYDPAHQVVRDLLPDPLHIQAKSRFSNGFRTDSATQMLLRSCSWVTRLTTHAPIGHGAEFGLSPSRSFTSKCLIVSPGFDSTLSPSLSIRATNRHGVIP